MELDMNGIKSISIMLELIFLNSLKILQKCFDSEGDNQSEKEIINENNKNKYENNMKSNDKENVNSITKSIDELNLNYTNANNKDISHNASRKAMLDLTNSASLSPSKLTYKNVEILKNKTHMESIFRQIKLF
jgi:hypothetical protein